MLALVFAALLVAAPISSDTQGPPSVPTRGRVSEYQFENGVIVSKIGDRSAYLLQGSGFLRATTFGDPKVFILNWLRGHPNATVTPISRMLSTNTQTHRQGQIVYIWVEDGGDSLNVDLIRAGVFAGGTMYDMVDNQAGLDRLLKSDPRLADARAGIEKERAAAPQDRSERLLTDKDYHARIARIEDAERTARAEKLGIWSDAMKDEREIDGLQ